MQQQLTPIQTEYNGYKFRSRLEARWAVFFDAMMVKYEYEPEGFDVFGTPYLPDFWIPSWETWLEIKPNGLGNNSEKVHGLCHELYLLTDQPVWLLEGSPWPGNYRIHVKPSEEFFVEDGELNSIQFEPREFRGCRRCEGLCWVDIYPNGESWSWGDLGKHTCGDHEKWPLQAEDHPTLDKAFRAARSARFEHGEKPSVRKP